MKKLLLLLPLILVSCAITAPGTSITKQDQSFIGLHPSVDLNNCFQIELNNMNSYVVELFAFAETTNKIFLTGEPRYQIYYFDDMENNWLKVDNSFIVEYSGNETWLIDPSSPFIHQRGVSLSIKPDQDIEKNMDREYRVYFEVDVVDGCDAEKAGAYYDFTYADLDKFFNHTLTYKTEEDRKNAIQVLQGQDTNRSEVLLYSVVAQSLENFINTPLLFNQSLGKADWNQLDEVMKNMGISLTIYDLENFEETWNKADIERLDQVTEPISGKDYIGNIEFTPDDFTRLKNIWFLIKNDVITDVVYEIDGVSLGLNFLQYFFKSIPEYDLAVVSQWLENPEENLYYNLQSNQYGYAIEYPQEKVSDHETCIGTADPLFVLIYLFNPEYQDSSELQKIFRQDFSKFPVKSYDMSTGCITK